MKNDDAAPRAVRVWLMNAEANYSGCPLKSGSRVNLRRRLYRRRRRRYQLVISLQ